MSKNLKFDALIIGSSFDALFTALSLESQGRSVGIIENDSDVGGLYGTLKQGDAILESHINSIPLTTTNLQMLEAIKNEVPTLELSNFDVGPITFHNGQVQPFVGFGETDIQAMDEYSAFLSAKQIHTNMGLGELTQKIREKIKGQILTQNDITAIELQPEVSIIVNGSQKISAREIYFFENPHMLSKLLSNAQHSIPKNLVQRLSKIPLWTAVNLTFSHSQALTESNAIHVLYGAKEQPCIGRFRFSQDVASSQWTTFVSQELVSDSEALGATIREMKKQIKRMYPNFFENINKEFIVISPDAYCSLPQGFIEHGVIPKTPQLKVGSRFYAETPGVSGDLETLATILSSNAPQEMAVEAQLT